jgi:tRNA-dihydrouridine synthase|tara:strand:- start:8117 stop:8392 length:276 start_codon:yes stop_codon:yes gene_type:complete
MNDIFDILTQYGVLGVWVFYAITRERWLLKKLEQISERATKEREVWHNERQNFLNKCNKQREDFIKEISLIRQEERNIYIKQLEKIYNSKK